MASSMSSMASILADLQKPRKRRKGGCHEDNEYIVTALVELMHECSIRASDHRKHSYARAIASLKKYPVPLTHGDQAKQLRGIGDYIANKIQGIILQNAAAGTNRTGAVPGTTTPASTSIAHTSINTTETVLEKLYVPTFEKMPWYILMSLWEAKAFTEISGMTQAQLQLEVAIAGCTEPVNKLKPGLSRLVSLRIIVRGDNSRFYLTRRGHDSAYSIAKMKKMKNRFHTDSQFPDTITTEHNDKPRSATKKNRPVKRSAASRQNIDDALSSVLFDDALDGNEESTDVILSSRLGPSLETHQLRQSLHSDRIPSTKQISSLSSSTRVRPLPSRQDSIISIEDSDSDEHTETGILVSQESTSFSQYSTASTLPPCRNETVGDDTVPTVATAFASLLEPLGTTTSMGNYSRPFEIAVESDKWQVILLLDTRETVCQKDRSILHSKLTQSGIHFQVRQLSLGDVMWIVQRHRTVNGRETVEEFVLDAIVERKTMDDLCSSFIDKRFLEQKDRLSNSGLKRVFYLIEGSKVSFGASRGAAITTALAMTQVHHHFLVQHCQHIDETVSFFAQIHAQLIDNIPPRCQHPPPSAPCAENRRNSTFDPTGFLPNRVWKYSTFQNEFTKTQETTIGMLSQRMLMQCPTLGALKVRSVSQHYPTIQRLYNAYNNNDDEASSRKLLQNIPCGPTQRRLGAKASCTVASIFS